MTEFIHMLFFSAAMVVITCLIFYEILRAAWDIIPRLEIRPRLRVLYVIFIAMAAHTICVWLYAFVYWFFAEYTDYGTLAGLYDHSFETALYFSTSTYSSLGYGDVYPIGAMRIMAGIQVINGLMLIGWSVSFTYLAMVKFWDLHHQQRK